MTTTEKVHNIILVKEDDKKEPCKCSCGSIFFLERPKPRDLFHATYVDCIHCGQPHRIGGFVWYE